jgi:hypothetical protein
MDQEKSLLKPYKALGIFTDNNKGHIYNAGEK